MTILQNVLLTTQITALKVKSEFVFIGEGQFLHIHNLSNGTRLITLEVFEAAVVHGIQIKVKQNEESSNWILSVWGQKSLAVLLYKPVQNVISVQMKERQFEDWIIDAALEDDLSHIIIATAHNSLLRYRLQQSSESCQKLENSESYKDGKIDTKELTWINTRWKGDKYVESKAECTENCILYCGHVVLMGGNWESAVLLAGTVFSQVLIWGPWCSKDTEGRNVPIHRLSGHEGVLFSVNFSAAHHLMTTTSDDRSLRMWSITGEEPEIAENSTRQVQQYWINAKINEKNICYGHGARVWQSLIIPSCIVSVGEDSKVCVWNHQGELVSAWKAHDGACVWNAAVSHDEKWLLTGGGDGSVKIWSLKLSDTQKAEPLLGGPWCNETESPLEIDNDSTGKELKEEKSEILVKGQNKKSNLADFPRCITMAGTNNYLIAMDSGRLFQWNSVLTSWTLVWEDKRMKSYVIMDVSADQKSLAIGMLCGVVLILTKNDSCWEMLREAQLCQGKVFSLFWLGSTSILTCGPDGEISTWRYLESEGAMNNERNHILPSCKQRWVSAACVLQPTDIVHSSLVCGDRAGSLHLYHKEVIDPKQTLKGIHGKNGVTSLVTHEGLVYSTGRDGCVRCLKVSQAEMQVLTVTRVSNVNWVAQVMFLQGRPMAICFHDIYLKVWSLEEDRAVVEVECGGGHRSWALQTSNLNDELIFFFLKDGTSYIFRTTLADKLMPLLKTPVNTRETMCLQTLFHMKGETVFVTGGEDTTIRIHSIKGLENHKPLCVVRSHISNIRALCRIEREVDNTTRPVWFVSAGGRAQMKVWKVIPYENNQINQDSHLFNVTCREVTSHMIRTGSNKTWKSQELTFDPETRYMDAAAFWVTEQQAIIILASSDGVLRIFQFSQQSEKLTLICSQVCDHCLLKVLKVPVKHRHIIISAGTDGNVIFWDIEAIVDWVYNSDVTTESPPKTLIMHQLTSILTHQSGINSLSFNSKMYTKVENQSSTKDNLILATGGDDNKLGVWEVLFDTSDAASTKIEAKFLCHATGHASQITGLEWISEKILVSASVDQRVVVWELYWNSVSDNLLEHNVQEEHSNLTTVCRVNYSSKPLLRVLSAAYSGVPDIKGLVVTPLTNCILNKKDDEINYVHRAFVYGVGLQIYNLDCSLLNPR